MKPSRKSFGQIQNDRFKTIYWRKNKATMHHEIAFQTDDDLDVEEDRKEMPDPDRFIWL